MTTKHTSSAIALTFHETTFNSINRNGQLWLTASEIAQALGYAREDSVSRIYDRRCEEFTSAMTETVKLTASGNLQKDCRIFSLRGAHLIGMFARTERAAEFRRWVLDILDRETAPMSEMTAVDLRAEVLAANSTPTAPLSPAVQSAINRQAWALAHDAYELIREHLARRVAYTSEYHYPNQVIDEKQALSSIAETTLDLALAPRHWNQVETVKEMAKTLAGMAASCRDQLSAEFSRALSPNRPATRAHH